MIGTLLFQNSILIYKILIFMQNTFSSTNFALPDSYSMDKARRYVMKKLEALFFIIHLRSLRISISHVCVPIVYIFNSMHF